MQIVAAWIKESLLTTLFDMEIGLNFIFRLTLAQQHLLTLLLMRPFRNLHHSRIDLKRTLEIF